MSLLKTPQPVLLLLELKLKSPKYGTIGPPSSTPASPSRFSFQSRLTHNFSIRTEPAEVTSSSFCLECLSSVFTWLLSSLPSRLSSGSFSPLSHPWPCSKADSLSLWAAVLCFNVRFVSAAVSSLRTGMKEGN